jgi:hypothetical protein
MPHPNPKPRIEDVLQPHLSANDDADFWRVVLDDLDKEFFQVGIDVSGHEIFLQIGSCSHWVRPHQRRLTAAGGFAYPSGYSESVYGYSGLPEYDWSLLFHRDKVRGAWSESPKFYGKRKLVCRVAIPNRTLLHNQAVVHIFWSPGTPARPREKARSYLAYRKVDGIWSKAASDEL